MSVIVAIHLAVALCVLLIGGIVLRLRKSTARHRLIGRVWVALMLVVAVGSFWIVEINDGAWSWIHLLSLLTIVSVCGRLWRVSAADGVDPTKGS